MSGTLNLVEETRWVPVDEHGERWAPRSKEQAFRDLANNPVGGCYSDGAPKAGITHIIIETRWVSPWIEVVA